MKITSKTGIMNGNNRISALKRLSKPMTKNNNNVRHRLSLPTAPVVTDARQLLTNRNKPTFDARQLLSRQSSKTSLPLRNDLVEMEQDDDDDEQETVFMTRAIDGPLMSIIPKRNNHLTEPISFTKTIKNTSLHREDHTRYSQTSNTPAAPLADQKVVISFVNDQYRKRPKSPSPPPPPIVRRLHDASMQTAHPSSSSSRSPIRTNTHRKYLDDHHEPPTKRTASRNTAADREQQVLPSTSKHPLQRTSTEASVSTRPKPASATRSSTDAATVLITNLQSSVTEDDVIELFSEVGDINDIQTLSRGCVQIIYSQHEQAEDAVAKYHNRLLDGKLMYVSLQPPTSYSTKSSKTSSTQQSKSSANKTNESLPSNASKMTIDPAFIRQALFNSSSDTSNAVQFQVKL